MATTDGMGYGAVGDQQSLSPFVVPAKAGLSHMTLRWLYFLPSFPRKRESIAATGEVEGWIAAFAGMTTKKISDGIAPPAKAVAHGCNRVLAGMGPSLRRGDEIEKAKRGRKGRTFGYVFVRRWKDFGRVRYS
jgi:hypothetical protein